MKTVVVASFVVAAALAPPPVVGAAVSTPALVNYQGRLADNTPERVAVNGTLPMEFRIYASALGADLLWTETWPAVEVADGMFSVLLGSQVALSPDLFAGSGTRFLEIVIDGEVLAPRQRVASAPFAAVADLLDGHEATELEESQEIATGIAAHAAEAGAHPPLAAAIEALGQAQADLAGQVETHVHEELVGLQVNVKAFGAAGDGATDDTAAVLAAIGSLSATGGEVLFPPGTYRISGPIVLPNDGAELFPRQPAYRLVGQGAHFDGRAGPPTGGSVLDLRYAAGPKISSYGLGYLEIHGLTLADFGTDGAPFVYSTNTTLHVHDVGFYGTHSGKAAVNDAIVLGGTGAESDVASNGPDAPFQGYGTVIRDSYFARVRRAVHGRVFANGVVFHANTVWSNCGSNLPGGAAIELDGDPDGVTAQVNAGWYVAGNLIETWNYAYGVRARESQRNAFVANNFFDPGPPTLAYYRLDDSATLNYILAGFHDDSRPFVDDQAPAALRSTVVNFHAAQTSEYPQPVRFQDTVRLEPGGAEPVGPQLVSASGAALSYRFAGGEAVTWQVTPPGGAVVDLVRAEAGRITLPATGVQISTGQGPPTAPAPNGSIYLRSEGAVGSTLYVREHGTWVPK